MQQWLGARAIIYRTHEDIKYKTTMVRRSFGETKVAGCGRLRAYSKTTMSFWLFSFHDCWREKPVNN